MVESKQEVFDFVADRLDAYTTSISGLSIEQMDYRKRYEAAKDPDTLTKDKVLLLVSVANEAGILASAGIALEEYNAPTREIKRHVDDAKRELRVAIEHISDYLKAKMEVEE